MKKKLLPAFILILLILCNSHKLHSQVVQKGGHHLWIGLGSPNMLTKAFEKYDSEPHDFIANATESTVDKTNGTPILFIRYEYAFGKKNNIGE